MAPSTRSPPKLGFVTIRVRMACTRSNISVFIPVGRLVDAVELERLRRAAAALIQGRDEPCRRRHPLKLFLHRATISYTVPYTIPYTVPNDERPAPRLKPNPAI